MTENNGKARSARSQQHTVWVVHDSGHALALFGGELAAYRYANPIHASVVDVKLGGEIPGAKSRPSTRRNTPVTSTVEVEAEPAEATP